MSIGLVEQVMSTVATEWGEDFNNGYDIIGVDDNFTYTFDRDVYLVPSGGFSVERIE